jgi:hypothetical protein
MRGFNKKESVFALPVLIVADLLLKFWVAVVDGGRGVRRRMRRR